MISVFSSKNVSAISLFSPFAKRLSCAANGVIHAGSDHDADRTLTDLADIVFCVDRRGFTPAGFHHFPVR